MLTLISKIGHSKLLRKASFHKYAPSCAATEIRMMIMMVMRRRGRRKGRKRKKSKGKKGRREKEEIIVLGHLSPPIHRLRKHIALHVVNSPCTRKLAS